MAGTSTTKKTTNIRSSANYQGVDTCPDFSTYDKFLGYRSREDKTMLPGNYMIYPSQNVLIDITGRLKNRSGMSLYGAANTTITPIYAYHDWEEHKNGLINLRAYSGNLQFDYNGTWTTIKSSLGTSKIRFTNYWNNGEVENVLLFVDGSTNVYEWNGATTTFASATTNTITKQGTTTWAEDGFYASGNKKIMLDGVEYTYTAGEGATTLTGVAPDPTIDNVSYLTFNGTTAKVATSSGTGIGGNKMTVSALVNPSSVSYAGGGQGVILCQRGTEVGWTTESFVKLSVQDGGAFNFRSVTGTFRDVSSTTLAVAGTWYRVTGTIDYDLGTISISVNGVLENTSTFAVGENYFGVDGNVFIGSKADSSSFYKGSIDDPIIYNSILTDTQIAALSTTFNKPSGYSLYFKFDEGSGSTANDESANNNDGTITAATYGTSGLVHLYGTGLIYQSVVTTANSAITSFSSTFKNDFISNLTNQIYYGSASSNNVYVSKQNDYKTCAFTAPVRVVGEGALITLRSLCSGFVVQEDSMYISGGKSQWYTVKKTLSSDNSKEVFEIVPLKTSAKQAALSQEAINHDRDSVVFLSNETRLVTLGRTLNIFGTPMMTDYSFPVAKDFDMFDFTDASVKFWKSKIYVTIPRESKWYIFNQTDPENMFWEAPQTGAFSGFMIDNNGDLYAHSYSTPETYKLFDGGSDAGAPILSRAKFAYTSYGNRGLSDYFSEYWLEGYISPNTKLKVIYNLDLDGCSSQRSGILSGDDSRVVCLFKDKSSLGKSPLGKNPLGGLTTAINPDDVPPYFNAVMVTPKKDFWKFSPEFESLGVDFDWQLIAFGPLVTSTMFGNNNIKINLS